MNNKRRGSKVVAYGTIVVEFSADGKIVREMECRSWLAAENTKRAWEGENG